MMEFLPIDDQIGFVKLRLNPADIPQIIETHRNHARPCEELGEDLINSDYSPELARRYVRAVCLWGRGHRFLGRVMLNDYAVVAQALRRAVELADEGNASAAVDHVRHHIRQLGLSFASKVVRCLRPSMAVVLDSRIRERLGYPETLQGYASFLSDCQNLLAVLSVDPRCEGINPPLRIADVEMAIYARLAAGRA